MIGLIISSDTFTDQRSVKNMAFCIFSKFVSVSDFFTPIRYSYTSSTHNGVKSCYYYFVTYMDTQDNTIYRV